MVYVEPELDPALIEVGFKTLADASGVDEAIQNFQDLIALFDGTPVEMGLLEELFDVVFDHNVVCAPQVLHPHQQEPPSREAAPLGYDDLFDHFVGWSILGAQIVDIARKPKQCCFDYQIEIRLPEDEKKKRLLTSTALVHHGKIMDLRLSGGASIANSGPHLPPCPATGELPLQECDPADYHGGWHHRTGMEEIAVHGGTIELSQEEQVLGSLVHQRLVSIAPSNGHHFSTDLLQVVDCRVASSSACTTSSLSSFILLQDRVTKETVAICKEKNNVQGGGGRCYVLCGRFPRHAGDKSCMKHKRIPFYPWYEIEETEHGDNGAFSIYERVKKLSPSANCEIDHRDPTETVENRATTMVVEEKECCVAIRESPETKRTRINISQGGADPIVMIFLAVIASSDQEGVDTVLRLINVTHPATRWIHEIRDCGDGERESD